MRAIAFSILILALATNEPDTEVGKAVNGYLGVGFLIGCIICIIGGW